MSSTTASSYLDLLLLALIPVVVGGVIGLLGGFLGPYFLQRGKEAADKKKKRAEKFEELVAVLHEHKHWLDLARGVRIFGHKTELTASPMARVIALGTVYFPAFAERISELDLASGELELWMVRAGAKRLEKDDSYTEGHLDVYKPYIKKFNEIMVELKAYARREFQ